jgi:hypothetical protein
MDSSDIRDSLALREISNSFLFLQKTQNEDAGASRYSHGHYAIRSYPRLVSV